MTSVNEYPYNQEFSNQFSSGNKLEYDEVVELRKRYANGEYWRDVYQDYKDIYFDEFFGNLIEERKQRDDLSHDIENFITKPIVFQEGDIKHD